MSYYMESTSTQTAARTRLKEILDDEGRKLTWLADRIGTSRSLVSAYCNGLHVPEDRKAQIAEALGRKIDDVFPEAAR
jgi:transcriptional regulator with XRE-family HTH domain